MFVRGPNQEVYALFARAIARIDPPEHFTELPKLTIQLPMFNELYVAERLLESVSKINYPKDKLELQVLEGAAGLLAKHNVWYIMAECNKEIIKKEGDRLLVLANQIGFEILVPAVVMAALADRQAGDEIALHLYYQQTERQPKPVLPTPESPTRRTLALV